MPNPAGGGGAANNATVQTVAEALADEEYAHQEELRKVHLEQAEQSVVGIEATIDGLKESLRSAKAELKRLKDGGRV